MLPEFELVERVRPLEIVAALSRRTLDAGVHPLPRPAPYAAATAPASSTRRTELEWRLGGRRFVGWFSPDTRRTGLDVHGVGELRTHRSRRHGRIPRHETVHELAVTLTGRHVALLTRGSDGTWETRARVDLRDVAPELDPHDTNLLATLQVAGPDGLEAGGFGHLGLRDIRWATHADGTPLQVGEEVVFTATHAGPGFFDTGHTGVWLFHPRTYSVRHSADLFFRRSAADGSWGVFGDHATHLVRQGTHWLVATSTWSDFDLSSPSVRLVLARTETDVLVGEHLLTAHDLVVPTGGLRSVGTWDPHLVHDGERWLVAFVSASTFFSFHPALAQGASLDDLTLLGADLDRTACEGVTLARLDARGQGEEWVLVASDGPDSPRAIRQQYPVFDLAVRQFATLKAPHLGNIPWPNLLRFEDRWLVVTFDGTPAGGALIDYGTHGDVLVMSAVETPLPSAAEA